MNPIETEPIEEPQLDPAPVEESVAPETPEPARAEQELDYERIVNGVAERIASAAQQYQHQAHDPYSEVADMIWENPAGAIQRTVDIATQNAIEAMMPFVHPVSQSAGIQHVSNGLNDTGREFVQRFVHDNKIDPALLNDPMVADLVRSKAELYQMKQTGQPIPSTEGVGGMPLSNLDADTRRELTGIERLYRNLNIKFDPAKLIGRMK
jgi:hypothetical protein